MTDNTLITPRPLTPSDISHLRNMFELQLTIQTEEEKEDAVDLINYALDMVGRGKNVGSVVEELAFMEYDVCDTPTAQKIGKCLASFLKEITRELTREQNRSATSHVAKSSMTSRNGGAGMSRNAQKAALIKGDIGSIPIASRSKKGIYDANGQLIKQWSGVKQKSGNAVEVLDVDAQRKLHYQQLYDKKMNLEQQQQQQEKQRTCTGHGEIDALQASALERQGIKEEIYDEHGNLKAWDGVGEEQLLHLAAEGDIHALEDRAPTKAKESMYDEHGNLTSAWGGNTDKEFVASNKCVSAVFQATDPKESMYDEHGNLKSAWGGNTDKEFVAANRHGDEISFLRKQSSGQCAKGQIYDEHGNLTAAWSSAKASYVEAAPSSSPNERDVIRPEDESTITLGEQKRREFEVVMKDHSLSREERSRKIDEIKARYAALDINELQPATTTGQGPIQHLSSADAAKKNASELEKLRERMKRGSVVSGTAQRTLMYNEDGELICDAAKNESEGPFVNPGMDLSTQGNLKKKDQELAKLRNTGVHRRGVKNSIYGEDGHLAAQWSTHKKGYQVVVHPREGETQEEATAPKGYDDDRAMLGEMKRLEFEEVMRDHSLSREQREARVEEIKDRYSALLGSGSGADSMYAYPGQYYESNPNDDGDMGKQKSIKPKNTRLDVSTSGNLHRKGQELEFLKASGVQRRDVKGQMYDENGNLTAAWSGLYEMDEGGDAQWDEMDSSAEGMRRRKAHEVDVLLSSNNAGDIRQHMYDEHGNIVACLNDDGGLYQDDPESAEGMRLRKSYEMERIRNAGKQMKDGATKSMYDENGNLVSAWNKLKEGDEGFEEVAAGGGMSPGGMKKKQHREIEVLRNSIGGNSPGAQMYDAEGNIVNPANTDSWNAHDVHNDMDESATGMMNKMAIEFEYITKGSVDHKETIPPRALTEDETEVLRKLLKTKLNIPSDDHEEDATDLLDYAMDMIEDGKNVGHVAEELTFLELPVFGNDMVNAFEECLSSYLIGLDGDLTLASRAKKSMYDSSGRIIIETSDKKVLQRKNSQQHEVPQSRLVFDTKTMSQRPGKEMNATLLGGPVTAKEVNKLHMYDGNGVLRNQWNTVKEDVDEPVVHGLNFSARAAANKQKDEINDILYKKKAGGGLGHRLNQYKDFVKPRGNLHHEGENHDEDRMNALANSSRAFSKRSSAEVAKTLLWSETSVKDRSKMECYDENGVLKQQWAKAKVELADDNDSARVFSKKSSQDAVQTLLASETTVKERSKMESYDEDGVLKQQWSKQKIEQVADVDAFADEERRKYFQQLENEKVLRDRIAQRDKAKREKLMEDEEAARGDGVVLRNSAAAQSRKNQQEVQQVHTDSKGTKKAIYDEKGAMAKQWNVYNEHSDLMSVDDQRREEMASIMKDRSLSKEERAERIETVKAKYDGTFTSKRSHGSDASPSVKVVENPNAKKRNEEFQQIMKDRSLTRDQRAQKIGELKMKYSTGSSHQHDATEPTEPGDSGSELSALAYARKASQEVTHLFMDSDISVKELNKKAIYDEHGVLVKQWANHVTEEGDNGEEESANNIADNVVAEESSDALASSFKAFMSKSVDEQRREEMRLIIRDKSLTKEQRAVRIDQVKARYAAQAAGKTYTPPVAVESETLPMIRKHSGPTSNVMGKSETLDAERRKELKAIMKNRTLNPEFKTRLMEEVKAKYDKFELQIAGEEDATHTAETDPINAGAEATAAEKALRRSQRNEPYLVDFNIKKEEKAEESELEIDKMMNEHAPPEPEVVYSEETMATAKHSEATNGSMMDLSASAFAQKHKNELQSIKTGVSEGKSIKERMAAFNNNNTATVHYDTVSFAASQNKKKSAQLEAQRNTKDSAMRYNYNYGDNSAVDETSAKFKQMGDDRKAEKKDAISANMQYNYNYGDGGKLDQQTADFKAMGDDTNAKKKESVESAKKYNYQYSGGNNQAETEPKKKGFKIPKFGRKSSKGSSAPPINCDPYAFAAKINKSAAAQRAAKQNTKDSAMQYNYKYTS